jgi:hypothetical protein
MTRNSPDDASRKGGSEAESIAGLLAYAATRRRWGGSALKIVDEAVARSRALAERCPGEHTELLAHCLRTSAKLLLKRRRAVEALPPAEEAVTLTRAAGGPPLMLSLHVLAAVLEDLRRYSEAAALAAEADKIALPPDD